MGKRNLKNYFKHGILLFGVSVLLWNCEKEPLNEGIPKMPISKKEPFSKHTFQEISIESDFKEIIIDSKIKKFFDDSKKSNLNKSSSKQNFSILKETVKKIKSEDYISYTFLIKRLESQPGIFENLILEKRKGEINALIIKYELSQEYLKSKNKSISGKLSIRKIEHNTAWLSKFNECYWVETWTRRDCTEHGFDGVYMEDCNNYGKDEYTYSSTYTCTSGAGTSFDNDIPETEDATSSGGGGDSSTTTTSPVYPCEDEIHNCDKELDECPAGMVYNSYLDECECPTGQVEDSNGNCVDKCETTVADLQKVFPNTSSTRLQEIADYVNKHGKDFGIDTDEKLQHFLAQAAHEATSPINGIEFDAFEEVLNFRWAKLGTKDYWDKYFNPITNPTQNPNKADPNNFKRSATSDFVDVQQFANHVYNDAKRRQGYKIGNTSPGDGYKYRGRGIFQLTGKYNYQKFTSFYQNKYNSTLDFSANPNLIASNTEIAVISALWFFNTRVGNITSSTTVTQVTRKINGRRKGLKHRTSLFNKVKIDIQCK